MEELLKNSTFWGAEQAITNYLIRENLLQIENLLESDVNSGLVLTNGLIHTEIQDNNILNLNGKIPAVVHQYDRHKDMVSLADRIYRLNDLIIEKNDYDIKSNLDIVSVYIKKNENFEALERFIYFLNERLDDKNYWRGSFNKLIKIFNLIYSANQRDFNSQLLMQCIDKAIILSLDNSNIDQKIVINLVNMIMFMKQTQITIYKEFEIFVSKLIWQFANILNQNDDIKNSQILLDNLAQIDYPLTKEYYLLSAKNNRLLGNNDKAIEYYKKALNIT